MIEFGESIFDDVPLGAVLLNMAVFGAVIAHLLQMISIIPLRQCQTCLKLRRLERIVIDWNHFAAPINHV
ncbi:MAG: hypothetical protein ACE5GS_16460, partial [Kiloniellaceae bacterium]